MHTYEHVNVYTHVYMCIYVCLHMCARMHACTHAHIKCTYTHIHISNTCVCVIYFSLRFMNTFDTKRMVRNGNSMAWCKLSSQALHICRRLPMQLLSPQFGGNWPSGGLDGVMQDRGSFPGLQRCSCPMVCTQTKELQTTIKNIWTLQNMIADMPLKLGL